MTPKHSDNAINLASIEEIIADAKAGKMYILVDDEDRENEGDLIIPAEFATPEAINFMAMYGRGLVCLPMTENRIRKLGLPMMTYENHMRHSTAFTVSIEAREGVTTGISAADRSHTILTAIDDTKGGVDLATPGHVFPLMARDGGVLVRAGHTEASVDISRLAGLNPSAVICEIMKDDGSMARLDDLAIYAKKHDLKIATIKDLIAYRLKHDNMIELAEETTFTRQSGVEWSVRAYKTKADNKEATALIFGDIAASDSALVRFHVFNPFEDLFGEETERTGQLSAAMALIEQEGRGVIIIFPGEHGNKPSALMAAKNIKKQGLTVKEEHVVRNIGHGAQIMIELGIKHLIVLSNTMSTVIGLDGYGLDITEWRPIPISANSISAPQKQSK